MNLNPQHMKTARALAVALIATVSLGACASYKNEFATINSRLDQLDVKVQGAAQSAESANQSAQQANQRLDQIEGRVQQRKGTCRPQAARVTAPSPFELIHICTGNQWPSPATGVLPPQICIARSRPIRTSSSPARRPCTPLWPWRWRLRAVA